jgi:hypothetical protein
VGKCHGQECDRCFALDRRLYTLPNAGRFGFRLGHRFWLRDDRGRVLDLRSHQCAKVVREPVFHDDGQDGPVSVDFPLKQAQKAAFRSAWMLFHDPSQDFARAFPAERLALGSGCAVVS